MVRIGDINLGAFPLLLAPMEDVSDPPFRHLCKKYGADMLYTEFISSDGLIRDAEKSIKKLDIYEDERPIGIQIFGGELEPMIRSAEIVEQAKPNLLDINFGCPVKNVVCRNAGAAILKDIPKMIQLTKAVVNATKLPVTVKTRLGWDEASIQIESVVEQLQDVGVKAVSIHARTRSQMYKGSANWEYLGAIKQNARIKIPVFGNGDIDSPEKALEMKNKYGVDGIMIGRAAIGYPWIFNEIKHFFATRNHLPPPDTDTRVNAAINHLERSISWKGEKLGILEMRRHYAPYFKGYENSKEFRQKLVRSEDKNEIVEILETVRKLYLGYTPKIVKNTIEGTYYDL